MLGRIADAARHLRGPAFALCGLFLAACVTSERPVLPQADAVRPLEAGRYATFERDGDAFKEGDAIEVRLRGEKEYDFVSDKGEVVPVSLHRLSDSRYVAQAQEKPSDPAKGYAYVVMDIAGGTATIYPADCDKQDKARMMALGVEVGRYECKIDRVADPRAFFAALEYGEPTSKMTRK